MDKRWQQSEIAYLKRHAHDTSVGRLAQRFHVDADTVQSKLGELGLTGTTTEPAADPALGKFEKALEYLHKGDHKKAAKAFEKVLESTDGRQLRARARQYLDICRRHLENEQDSEDPYLLAVYEKNRGAFEKADALARQGGDGDERYVYLRASIQALQGHDDAVTTLARAIELNPRNRVHAFHDPDFEELRQDEAFADLLAQG